MRVLRKIYNLIVVGKWTDCDHAENKHTPIRGYHYKCDKAKGGCGAEFVR